MGLESHRGWPLTAKVSGPQRRLRGGRNVRRVALGHPLVTPMFRKSTLDKRRFLVTGPAEHSESFGTFMLPSATMLTRRVVSFKACLVALSLKIVGCRGIGIAKGGGLSSWWLLERFCCWKCWFFKYLCSCCDKYMNGLEFLGFKKYLRHKRGI